MMLLSDIRDYIAGLDMAEQCYMGKLDAKKDNSIGCYHLRRSGSSHIPLGGRSNATYDIHIDPRQQVCRRNRTNGT